MPATGNNKKLKEKLLSIRLSPDGLSFWTSKTGAAADGGRIPIHGTDSAETAIAFGRETGMPEDIRKAAGKCIGMCGWSGGPLRIMLDTPKTVLVPSELFADGQAENYLKVNNITVSAGEEVLVSELSSGGRLITAIMVYDRAALDTLREIFGSGTVFTSPFDTAYAYRGAKHKKRDADCDFTTMHLTPGNVYLTVQTAPDCRWKYSEVLPHSSAADILYYMQELSARFKIRKTRVFIKGHGAENIAKALRKPFRRCKCE